MTAEDTALNLWPYFSTTAYSGYGDDEKVYFVIIYPISIRVFIVYMKKYLLK